MKHKIIEMALNGSGIRDTGRVLNINPKTVMAEIKKANQLENINQKLLKQLNPEKVDVQLTCIKAAEADEMWAYVGNKKRQRWLWHAIDHISGKTLAYVFGRRKDKAFLQLKDLLKPFGIKKYYTN